MGIKPRVTTFEQFEVLVHQIENIYTLISNTNKFYTTLLSSIVGAGVLLYTNKITPNDYFNYFFYIILIAYAICVIWYRTLFLYLYDLNSKSDAYMTFIKENKIISMYELSISLNVKKTNLVMPFLLGGLIFIILVKYSYFANFSSCIFYIILYSQLFCFSFIYGFDTKLFKYF